MRCRTYAAIATFCAVLALTAGSVRFDARQQRDLRATVETQPTSRAEVIRSSDALPAHIATGFAEPVAFTQSASGAYLVFDRRGQAVYTIDRNRTEATRLVQIGPERGRILRPSAFGVEPSGESFVVVDHPTSAVRIQRFADRGYLLNGFTLPLGSQSITLSGYVGGGIASLQFTGDDIFLSRPETGSLIEEYSWDGRMRRAFGALRATGQEGDGVVHLALNAGLPLVDPTGGFYFVFQSGVPLFRRYDASGHLVFERHIEGRELDAALANQPAAWPKRLAPDGTETPAVPILIATAVVDPRGRLWVVLMDGTVYVYSPEGDKIRSLRLRAAGPLIPTSLFFAGPSRLLVTPGCYIFDVSQIVL